MSEKIPFGQQPIKEECPDFGETDTNVEAPEDSKGPIKTFALLEEKNPSIFNNEIDYIKELNIKDEKHILPIVKIKRIFELEQALKGEIKNEPKDGGNIYCGKSQEQMSASNYNTSRDKTQIAEDNTSQYITMFVCSECNTCFKGKTCLENHLCKGTESGLVCYSSYSKLKFKTHFKKPKHCQQDEPLICATCGLQFHEKNLLVRHCKIHLKAEKKQCKICKVNVKCNWIHRHLASHFVNFKPFSCSECGKSFKSNMELKIHLLIHTKVMNYVCTYCKRTFMRKQELVRHIEAVHSEEKKTHPCGECSKRFAFKSYVKIHKLKAHSESRPLSCNECGDTFKDKKCLMIHTNTHTGLKPYPCSFCDKKFAQYPHMKRHERLHTGDKPFVCQICRKSFRDSSNLKVHQIFHSGKRPFKCDECEKDFTQLSHLNTHKKTHSKERPFVCTVCGDSFKARGVLKSHLLLHSDIKPYNCEHCGRSFVQATAFKRHKCYF